MNKKWFTLIELLITILILAILLTISFFSYTEYTKMSRDSVRLNDIQLIKQSLELFSINASKYPKPDNGTEITFADKVAWDQWTINKFIIDRLDLLDRIPVDPKYWTEYTYSLVRDWFEYQIGTISEWSSFANININDTYAEIWKTDVNVTAITDWNYNEIALVLTHEWWFAIFALPSIILPDLTLITNLANMVEWSLVISWEKCLPDSYKNYSEKCVVDFIPELLFIWSNLPLSVADMMVIINRLQEIYASPIFDKKYEEIATMEPTQLFIKILEEQVPEATITTFRRIIELWLDEYIEEYWSVWIVSSTTWTWTIGGASWYSFFKVWINDPDLWTVNCNSCIEF